MKRKLMNIMVGGSLCICGGMSQLVAASHVEVTWDGTLILPPICDKDKNIGVAGAFAGVAGGRLLIAGGANFINGFPWTGAAKVWHKTLYSYDFEAAQWQVYPDFMPDEIGYGVSISLPQGIMFIGGNNLKEAFDTVYLISINEGRPLLDACKFPNLPYGLSCSAGARVGNQVFLAGGIVGNKEERSSHIFLKLDLDRIELGWQEQPSWPGPELGFSVAAESNGKFYLFGGRNFGLDKDTVISLRGYCFDPSSNQWSILDGDFPVMAATAATIDDEIWFFGGVEKILPTDPSHPGFSRVLRRYIPATGKLEAVDEAPYPIAVTTTAVQLTPSQIALACGEERPGVRTPIILQCTIHH